MGERQLNIAFAEPKQSDLAATSQGQSKVAYVGGLPEGTNDSKLQDALLSYGEVRPGCYPLPLLPSAAVLVSPVSCLWGLPAAMQP